MSDRHGTTYGSAINDGRTLRVEREEDGKWNFTVRDSGPPSHVLGATITDEQAKSLTEQLGHSLNELHADLDRAQRKAEAYKHAYAEVRRMHGAHIHHDSKVTALMEAQEDEAKSRLELDAARDRLNTATRALEEWS